MSIMNHQASFLAALEEMQMTQTTIMDEEEDAEDYDHECCYPCDMKKNTDTNMGTH